MTHDLAAALLRDVKRHGGWHALDPVPVMYEAEVLAALSRALDPALTERAVEVLEGVSDAPWRVGHLESYEMSGLAFRRVYFPTASEGEIHEAHIRGEDCDENARFIAWCREGVPALLAQIAALRAERDEHRRNWERAFNANTALEAKVAALTARVERLTFPDNWRDRAHSFKGFFKLQQAWADGFNAARAALTTEEGNE